MKRRDLIAGALIALTVRRAQAQQTGKVYHIAIVSPAAFVDEMSETSSHLGYRSLFEELRRLGYVEGQNLIVERFSGGGQAEQYAELARKVPQIAPDVILANTTGLVRLFKEATATISIVGLTADPIAGGIAQNLARPGGNITGISTDAGFEIWGKRLELLREAVPGMSRVGYLASRRMWESRYGALVHAQAQKIGVSLVGPPLEGSLGEGEYRRVMTAMVEDHADAILTSDQQEHLSYLRTIVDLAEELRLPGMHTFREIAEAGGLLAYAFDRVELYRHAAGQIDQILRGTKPGEIPYYQITKFELVINLKTAKALGLTIPPSLLARADEVIE
jgi:putative tryptophan/tyrosine transport system substrate-binding protein